MWLSKSLSPPITAYDSTWAPSAAPRLHRELTLGFCLSPPELLLSTETAFLYFYISVPEKKEKKTTNISLTWKILISKKEKKHPLIPQRHAKFCSPIPYGLNYPVIQESFLFSCVDQAGVKGFSVFEMVYVNVAFIETSLDVITVLLSTYEQPRCSTFSTSSWHRDQCKPANVG